MKALAAILSLVALLLQEPSAPKATISVDVDLQEIVATVRDNAGKIRKGLRASDFIVEDEGVRQTIVHFSDDPDAPVSLGLLIDNSSSMTSMPGGTVSGIQAATGIARVFLSLLKPADEVSLMAFANGVQVVQPFTNDHVRLENALGRMRANGRTGILDALDPALQEVKRAKYRKRALIVMTDAYYGGELDSVAGKIRRAEVPIFTFVMRGGQPSLHYANGGCTAACHAFGVVPPVMPAGMGGAFSDHTQEFLDTLARESGGLSSVFEIHSRNTMERIAANLDTIAAELRGQYVLGYYPRSGALPSRVIRVRTNSPDLRVHIRREAGKLDSR